MINLGEKSLYKIIESLRFSVSSVPYTSKYFVQTLKQLGSSLLCFVTQLCQILCDLMDCSLPGSSVLGDSPGKNTGVGCHALLLGLFLIQRSNPCLLSPALTDGFFTTSATWEALRHPCPSVYSFLFFSHIGQLPLPTCTFFSLICLTYSPLWSWLSQRSSQVLQASVPTPSYYITMIQRHYWLYNVPPYYIFLYRESFTIFFRL